jgi:hypothetical protein
MQALASDPHLPREQLREARSRVSTPGGPVAQHDIDRSWLKKRSQLELLIL